MEAARHLWYPHSKHSGALGDVPEILPRGAVVRGQGGSAKQEEATGRTQEATPQ